MNYKEELGEIDVTLDSIFGCMYQNSENLCTALDRINFTLQRIEISFKQLLSSKGAL